MDLKLALRINCLGRDITSRSLQMQELIRQSKWSLPMGRVDFLGKWIRDPSSIPIFQASDYTDHVQNHYQFYLAQRTLQIPDILIIDTWSDLVHQLFTINQRSIIGNYREISQEAKGKIKSQGRMKLEAESYGRHIVEILNLGIKTIIAIDFPAVLDKRAELKRRSSIITKGLIKLAEIDKRVELIQIPYSLISGDGYHFSEQTKMYFLDEFEKQLTCRLKRIAT